MSQTIVLPTLDPNAKFVATKDTADGTHKIRWYKNPDGTPTVTRAKYIERTRNGITNRITGFERIVDEQVLPDDPIFANAS